MCAYGNEDILVYSVLETRLVIVENLQSCNIRMMVIFCYFDNKA